MRKKRIAIFGSTGSIGTQALEVIAAHPGFFETEVLTAQRDADKLIAQARKFHPNAVVIGDEKRYAHVKSALADLPVKVFAGPAALVEVAAWDSIDVMLA